ncbi:putative ribonuclease H-like domain-containing protein [Tanacetum coccineum]
MPPRMRTQSAGRPVAKSRGKGMGERVGRGVRGRGPRGGNDERVDELNGQGNDQEEGANGNVEGVNEGNVGNQNGNVVNKNAQENIMNVLVNNNQICTLSQEVGVSMSWNDFKFMMIEEFYPSHEMQKLETELWNYAMVGASHAAYTDRFHELARLVPHLVTLKSRKIERYVYDLAPQIRRMVAAMDPKTMQKAVQISGALTDEEERIRVLGPRVPPATPTMHPEGLVEHASIVTAQGALGSWQLPSRACLVVFSAIRVRWVFILAQGGAVVVIGFKQRRRYWFWQAAPNGNPKGGKITGKGTIKTGNLDFENVYFVRELKFNLFSVSQMCDKKNSVLFNDTECIVLSPNFKLIDESQVLLRVPRKNNMYSVDLKNIVPKGGLTCLFAKATSDESKLWHRRLGHLNFKTMNKLVKGNLVRGLPSKLFKNDQTCVACQKGKQHKASCKSKTEKLHMDLFGPTFVKSLKKKMYCLVVTDDYSRFTWVFFLATKDETSDILKSFITRIENLVYYKVKVIRCDNGSEFKNRGMNQFCKMKGILRQLSVARTPQQNGIAKRRNMTLIEAARTILADYKLPTTFWAEAINTACYVQNKVLVIKPHNKTPYELFHGRIPNFSFKRPFGCPVTILNTIDHLRKFDGKADEGTKASDNAGQARRRQNLSKITF